MTISELRKVLKERLYNDRFRRVWVDGQYHICEGMAYRPHTCNGGIEMNEVIYPRNIFQNMKERDQAQFYNEINCALMCTVSHTEFGHSREFRDWWREFQAKRGYKVEEWISRLDARSRSGTKKARSE